MMFLFYYFWILINFLFFLNLNFFTRIYLFFNRFSLIFRKSFETYSFFEKFFLSFLARDHWLFSSVCHFINFKKEIYTFRENNFPIISFFFVYSRVSKNTIKNIFFLKKQYSFFNFLTFFEWLVFKKLFFKKYYNLLNLYFYKRLDTNNLIKLNFLFFYLNNFNFFKKTVYLNLDFYQNWYNYFFLKKITFNFDKKIKKSKTKQETDLKKFNDCKKILSIYKKNFFLKLFGGSVYLFPNSVYSFTLYFLKYIKIFKIKYKNKFVSRLKLLTNKLPIRFSDSSVNKYINFNNFKNYSFLFLRKNRIFNKGRYSRNRQLYRTGVYWCLWLNIIIVYGLYFFFYRFTFNFGYVWFGLFILIFSTIFSRIVKYKFYNLYNLYFEFTSLLIFFNLFIINLLNNFFIFIKNIKINLNFNLLLFNKSNFLIYNFIFFFKFFLNYFLKKIFLKNKYNFVFLWNNYSTVDNSLFRYKSIINWFKQFYKMLIY